MAEKITPFDKITIRTISTKGEPQKVKFVYPAVANNKQLMKNVGFVISDPNYEAKMECIRMKKPYSENGMTKEPVKEAFAPKIEPVKTDPKIEQPKNEIKPMEFIIPDEKTQAFLDKKIAEDERKVKRTRRTKAQMLEAKTKTKQTA